MARRQLKKVGTRTTVVAVVIPDALLRQIKKKHGPMSTSLSEMVRRACEAGLDT